MYLSIYLSVSLSMQIHTFIPHIATRPQHTAITPITRTEAARPVSPAAPRPGNCGKHANIPRPPNACGRRLSFHNILHVSPALSLMTPISVSVHKQESLKAAWALEGGRGGERGGRRRETGGRGETAVGTGAARRAGWEMVLILIEFSFGFCIFLIKFY